MWRCWMRIDMWRFLDVGVGVGAGWRLRLGWMDAVG